MWNWSSDSWKCVQLLKGRKNVSESSNSVVQEEMDEIRSATSSLHLFVTVYVKFGAFRSFTSCRNLIINSVHDVSSYLISRPTCHHMAQKVIHQTKGYMNETQTVRRDSSVDCRSSVKVPRIKHDLCMEV